ncbi:putative glycosyltransferase STELLO2 isoform X2 [Iris pallida]|uniref:Glycosyltransferase STELLO2 isoform X2 n=1 Tax=Iris pallida TaxID=29817 RepID=A0AAX6EFM5_IRIPA|nr:putative glycosyltransferase STELLO2 isoform X2 [Iris pallida]
MLVQHRPAAPKPSAIASSPLVDQASSFLNDNFSRVVLALLLRRPPLLRELQRDPPPLPPPPPSPASPDSRTGSSSPSATPAPLPAGPSGAPSSSPSTSSPASPTAPPPTSPTPPAPASPPATSPQRRDLRREAVHPAGAFQRPPGRRLRLLLHQEVRSRNRRLSTSGSTRTRPRWRCRRAPWCRSTRSIRCSTRRRSGRWCCPCRSARWLRTS